MPRHILDWREPGGLSSEDRTKEQTRLSSLSKNTKQLTHALQRRGGIVIMHSHTTLRLGPALFPEPGPVLPAPDCTEHITM